MLCLHLLLPTAFPAPESRRADCNAFYPSGESEVELCCGAIEMRNAREGAGMRALLWPEGSLKPVPTSAIAPPAPPQVQLVYTNEDGPIGNRAIVVNVHGTKVLFVPAVFAAVLAFVSTGRSFTVCHAPLPQTPYHPTGGVIDM